MYVVRSRGVTVTVLLEADRRLLRVAALLDVRWTDDVFKIRWASASVYCVHDRAQFEVNTTADRQPVHHH